jgi:hypothetical protein
MIMIVREEKCPACDGGWIKDYGFEPWPDSLCHGTGRIIIPLSTEEALELLGTLIELTKPNEYRCYSDIAQDIADAVEGVKVTG